MRIDSNYNPYRNSYQQHIQSREERVKHLKRQIDEGAYKVDLSDVAKKLAQNPSLRKELGLDE
jgi:anti-sigma28 factor (negative regulator of flagellin synthesis)